MIKRTCIIILLVSFCAGCGIQLQANPPATPAVFIITSTLPPTATPRPTETPLPPTPTATIIPVEGLTSTQLNVRAEPSTASEVLGIILVNTKVQIIGKDPGENWWQILYPQGKDGKGWVTAQYVTTAGKPEVPVIGGADSNPNSSNLAIIQQQLNIRSGPGTNFNSIGTLNPQDVVTLTGKDANGTWLQIEFPSGPDGKGWISAAFTQATGVGKLPIVGDMGQVIGTGTPVDTPLPPSPTVVPAPMDHDSAQAPAVDVTFSANGTQALQYSSDVSAPTGDTGDWIQFTPDTGGAQIKVACTGNGALTIELLQNNEPVSNWNGLTCNSESLLSTSAGTTYLLYIQAVAGEGLGYVHYTININSIP